jgi:hypothetical protein
MIEATVLGPITLLAVATRLFSRYKFSKTLDTDDHFILVASSIYLGTIVVYIVSKCNLRSAAYTLADVPDTILGSGKHIWNIDLLKIRILLLVSPKL